MGFVSSNRRLTYIDPSVIFFIAGFFVLFITLPTFVFLSHAMSCRSVVMVSFYSGAGLMVMPITSRRSDTCPLAACRPSEGSFLTVFGSLVALWISRDHVWRNSWHSQRHNVLQHHLYAVSEFSAYVVILHFAVVTLHSIFGQNEEREPTTTMFCLSSQNS